MRYIIIMLCLPALIGCAAQAPINITDLHKPIPNSMVYIHRQKTAGGVFADPVPILVPDIAAAEDALSKNMDSALLGCKTVLSYYAVQATTDQYVRYGLSIVGALAGGIGVPLAIQLGDKIFASALGGISGFTNVAQLDLTNQGLSANNYLSTREGIRQSMVAPLENFTSTCDKAHPPTTDYVEWYNCKKGSVVEIQASCTSYAITDPNIKLTTTLGQ